MASVDEHPLDAYGHCEWWHRYRDAETEAGDARAEAQELRAEVERLRRKERN